MARVKASGDFGDVAGPHYRDFAEELKRYVIDKNFQVGQRFPTIRQLVRTSKLSLSTVHKALGLLQDEGVLEARHGSGYYVKSRPSSERRNGRKEILVLMPYFVRNDEYWYTGKIIEGMLFAAQEADLKVSFERIPEGIGSSEEKREKLLGLIKLAQPDGVIWLHAYQNQSGILNEIRREGIKVITTMRKIEDSDIPVLRDDDYAFSSQALSAFKMHNHRRLGVFVSDRTDEYYRERLRALQDTADSLDVVIKDSAIQEFSGHESVDEQVEMVQAYFEANPDVTGVIVLYSHSASYLGEAMRRCPERLPKALSVLYNVLDGTELPQFPLGWHPVSTIAPPLTRMGRELISWIVSLVDGGRDYRPGRLIPCLEVKASMRRLDPVD
ncbi:MAG: LacI family DNA-binding transcriptional regulator [Opitutales bacterium]|nr:LacI family DNA-binding transcriptional regulator [Opitutales bacterium]